MTDFLIEGVVIEKTPEVSFTDKSERMHTECMILIETEEMYPQRLAIKLLDKLCAEAPSVGKKVKCYLSFSASQGSTGQWFNHIKAWRVVE